MIQYRTDLRTRLVYVCSFFVALFLGLSCYAQSTAPATQMMSDHEALKKMLQVYEDASSKGQPDLLKPYLDPEFTGVMVTGDEVASQGNSLNEFWNNIQQYLGQSGQYQVKAELAGPATISGDIAIAHGTTQEMATKDGKTYQFKGLWTAVCRKTNGEWKVYRIHASMYPISNPFVAEIVKYTRLISVGVGGVVGLFVGAILVIVLRKRRPAAP